MFPKITFNQRRSCKKKIFPKKNISLTKNILAKKIDKIKILPKKFPQKNNLEKNILPNKFLLNKIVGKFFFWLTFGFVWLIWFPHPYSYLGRKFNLLHKPRKLKFGMQVQLTKRR